MPDRISIRCRFKSDKLILIFNFIKIIKQAGDGIFSCASLSQQESPAIADEPARRESLPKIAPIRRAYNVVADDTGLSSFV